MIIDRREMRNEVASILALLTANNIKPTFPVAPTLATVVAEEITEPSSEQE